MASERETLLERITARREERGLTERELSLRATGKPDLIRDMKRRRSTPNGPTLAALARELSTTTDWLLGRAEGAGQPLSEVSFRDVRPDWRGPGDGSRIPVYGTGYCDDLEVEEDGHAVAIEQTLFEPHHVVQMIERPAVLWAAKDAYAIYFHGESMEPRFWQGEIGIVNPGRPPGPGDCVVVQLTDGASDDVIHVLVKQLVRAAGSYVELRQFNPDRVFRIDRKRIARMHLILSPAHLYL